MCVNHIGLKPMSLLYKLLILLLVIQSEFVLTGKHLVCSSFVVILF